MSDRTWFYASEGKQQGPYPETQLRDLIVRGIVTADSLVWSEGMAGWQRAGDIPGLAPGVSRPPVFPGSGAQLSHGGGYGGPLSIDPPIWSFLGQALLYVIGLLLVIPAPWTATSFYRWMASHIQVPERPNFAFTGQVGDIWYVFVAMGLLTYVGSSDFYYLQNLVIPIQAFLSWMTIRWIAANLSSNGQPLPISFNGSALGYIGWNLLMFISIITIIGWAWVLTAWMRWNCRNIGGTHREVVFNATGLEMLWRTVVFSLGCAFIIPIPWMLRWYARWNVSQFALVDRTV